MFRAVLTSMFATLQGKPFHHDHSPPAGCESVETRKLSRVHYLDSKSNWSRQLLKELLSTQLLRRQKEEREKRRRAYWPWSTSEGENRKPESETSARPYPTPEPAQQRSRQVHKSEQDARARWFSSHNEQQYDSNEH